jgi:hypothetical protein
MSRLVSYRPSPALGVALLALFLVLGGTGGAAVNAAPPKNSVGTAQLKNNAVTSAKIKNSAVAAAKIASNAVSGAKIAGNAVTSAKVQDGSLTAADLGSGVLPPSDAFAAFANGPVNVPVSQATIASLAIPAAGNYVIFAKASVTALLAGSVSCRLEAGANFDSSQAHVVADQPSTISLIVVNNFAAAGTVNLACTATPPQQANFIKIVALKVANLTNTG